jgi:hypothetical protein
VPLDHTVTNGGNGKNADLCAPVLRYFLLPHPHGLIHLLDQFALYLFQKTLHSAFLNGCERHSVYARGSVITFRHLVGFLFLDVPKLNSPAHYLRIKRHLAMSPARVEARMESLFSFPVGLFHPLQHAGLPRRFSHSRQTSGMRSRNGSWLADHL